jgi:hypothetical protein
MSSFVQSEMLGVWAEEAKRAWFSKFLLQLYSMRNAEFIKPFGGKTVMSFLLCY